MEHGIKEHLGNRKTWQRALYMLLFIVIWGVAEFIISVLVAFQLLSSLFTGGVNERLLKFGQSLSTYVYQIMLFLTFNSEQHPYPFGAWPRGAPVVKSK